MPLHSDTYIRAPLVVFGNLYSETNAWIKTWLMDVHSHLLRVDGSFVSEYPTSLVSFSDLISV